MNYNVSITYAGVSLSDPPPEYFQKYPYKANFFDIPWTASTPGHGIIIATKTQYDLIKLAVEIEEKGDLVLECWSTDENGEKVVNDELSVTLKDIYIIRATPVWGFSVRRAGTTDLSDVERQGDLVNYEGLIEIELQDERSYLSMRVVDTNPVYNAVSSDTDISREFISATTNGGTPYTIGDIFNQIFSSIGKPVISFPSGVSSSTVPVEINLVGIPSLVSADLMAFWNPTRFIIRYNPSTNQFGGCSLTDNESLDEYLSTVHKYMMYGGPTEIFSKATKPGKLLIYERDKLVGSAREKADEVDPAVKRLYKTSTITIDSNRNESVVPIVSGVSFGTSLTPVSRSTDLEYNNRLFHAVYSGFHLGFLDANKPISMVRFSWMGGIPFTEVNISGIEPIRNILEGSFSKFSKNMPLRLVNGDISLPDIGGGTASEGKVFQALVTSVNDDYLICKIGGDTVLVAKDYELRRTGWDGQTVNGVSYNYSGPQDRTASVSGQTQDETIVPPYIPNRTVITVAKCSVGSLNGSNPIEYIDISIGRAWAKI